MFSISAPASSRAFLSLAEIKAAVGETGSSNDAALSSLGAQITDSIVAACGVPSDGVNPPTLMRETIVETIRPEARQTYFGLSHQFSARSGQIDDRAEALILSRRFVSSASVVIDGQTLSTSLFEIDAAAGLLRYLDSAGSYILWPRLLTVVTYQAGFVSAPEPLKLAATLLIREAWAISQRDPSVRAASFEGLGSFQYGSGSFMSQAGGMPPGIADLLAPYKHLTI